MTFEAIKLLLGKIPVVVWIVIIAALCAWGITCELRIGSLEHDLDTTKLEFAKFKEASAEATTKAVKEARAEEQRRFAVQQEVVNEIQKQRDQALQSAKVAQASADSSKRDADVLRNILSVPRTCGSTNDPIAPNNREAANALTDVLGSCIDRYQELGREAEASRLAGLECERLYDSLIKKITSKPESGPTAAAETGESAAPTSEPLALSPTTERQEAALAN